MTAVRILVEFVLLGKLWDVLGLMFLFRWYERWKIFEALQEEGIHGDFKKKSNTSFLHKLTFRGFTASVATSNFMSLIVSPTFYFDLIIGEALIQTWQYWIAFGVKNTSRIRCCQRWRTHAVKKKYAEKTLKDVTLNFLKNPCVITQSRIHSPLWNKREFWIFTPFS